jgi:hypothetical protein
LKRDVFKCDRNYTLYCAGYCNRALGITAFTELLSESNAPGMFLVKFYLHLTMLDMRGLSTDASVYMTTELHTTFHFALLYKEA